ncbi:MAG: hypothetical protein ABIO46_01935 [Chitinophagales bacterium]
MIKRYTLFFRFSPVLLAAREADKAIKLLFDDGKSYEGIGMISDIVSHNTESNLQLSIDDQLDKALEQFQ